MSAWRNAANEREDVKQFMRDCLQQDEAATIAENLEGTAYRAFADFGIALRRFGQEYLFAYAPTWYLRAWATKYYEGRPGYSYWWERP